MIRPETIILHTKLWYYWLFSMLYITSHDLFYNRKFHMDPLNLRFKYKNLTHSCCREDGGSNMTKNMGVLYLLRAAPRRQPARKLVPQCYKSKNLNSSNNLNGLGSRFFLRASTWELSLADTLISAWWGSKQRSWLSHTASRLLI